MRSIMSLVVLLALTAACGSTIPTSPDTSTTFHLTDRSGTILTGYSVCNSNLCTSTDLSGNASLQLPLNVQVFVTFTGEDKIPYGELYIPKGTMINVTIPR